MRIVIDTNVLLAGVATHGLCESLLLLCYRDHVVVLSDFILREVARHYRGKFKASPEQVRFVLRMLRTQSEIVTPAKIAPDVFEDPDDLPILGTAVAGQAQCIITGDRALLALGSFHEIPILSPRAFYDHLRA
ncbi:MAG: putative toxin-antitoxin system toxin component, PIN family [Phycisphaeraceae bacterium]|nr:putative toxin-antitoxin system toxin component, PIN family [Phycisphaeraceae bacterium]